MNRVKLISVALFCVCCSRAGFSVLLASESFSSAGYLDAVNFGATNQYRTNTIGTVGFSSANNANAYWIGSTANVQPIHAVNLSHPAISGSAMAGGAIVRSPREDFVRQSSRRLASEPAGTTFFMSGLVSVNGPLTNMKSGEQASMGLSDQFSNTAFNRRGFGLGLYRDEDSVFLAAFANNSVFKLGDALTDAQLSQAHHIVLKLEIGVGATDALTAWYAVSGTSVLISAGKWENLDTADNGADICVFGLQSLGVGNTDPAGVAFDEWRFGSTMKDVTAGGLLRLIIINN